MKRAIAIGLSPNTQSDDVLHAFQQLLMPWQYQKGLAIAQLEQWFQEYFKIPYAVSFNSARSALYIILKSLDIGNTDEVILQAFTCIVVPNAILARGAKPVYADINQSLTLDPHAVEKKITKKTKAILVQHTFGIPTDMDAIIKIAKKHNLFVIEDVAHTIGGTYKGKKLGTFGDAAIFSFGRDKAFSSIFGGIAITPDETLGEKLRSFQQQKAYPSNSWIMQQLFHPIAFFLILPFYDFFGLGKFFLFFLQKLHMLSFPVTYEEKKGRFDAANIKRLPHALAVLALRQLKKIDEYNKKRKDIAKKYKDVCDKLGLQSRYSTDESLLRFPVFVEDPKEMRKIFRQHGNIYLGDWYANVIDPKESDFIAIGYKRGSCPNAELLASKIVNLPTYPAMSDNDVEKVIDVLKLYCHSES